MKPSIIAALLLLLIGGCSTPQDSLLGSPIKTTPALSEISELVLTEEDLNQLGMESDHLEQLGMNTSNGTDCKIEEYQTNEYSPLGQYGICSYLIDSLNDTEVVIELKKFTNLGDRNGSYQYDSLHLFSNEGLISENDFGELSRFRVNSENDYGGEFNDPSISYYHLWIAKNEYLIHITSKGSEDAKEYISNIGRKTLSKFE